MYKHYTCLTSLRKRQGKEKRSPFIDLAFRPNFAFVSGNDPMDISQADSVAVKLPLGMQALEGLEELGCIFHVKAGTIIVDLDLPETR